MTESSLFNHDDRRQWTDRLDDGLISLQNYLEADQISYGEDWEGMASHVSDMHALDRIIFEDCYYPTNGGMVSHPRLIHSDGKTKYFRYEYIARRLQCNSTTAERFITDWQRLNLTNTIIEKIITGIQKKNSLAKASLYFTRMAASMPDVDLMERDNTLDFLQDDIADSDDATGDKLVASLQEDEDKIVSQTYRFIPVGETGDDIAPDPLSFKYKKLIMDLNKTYSVVEIKKICKYAFTLKMDNFNTNMFLRTYRDRKAEAVKFWLDQNKTFHHIYCRVEKANKTKLNKVGHWLTQLASGQVKVKGYVPNANFTAILKDLYFQRKNAKAPKEKDTKDFITTWVLSSNRAQSYRLSLRPL